MKEVFIARRGGKRSIGEKRKGFIARQGEKEVYRGKEKGFHSPSRRKRGL